MSSRWMSKPPCGSMVNWGHPLSKGLVGCWLMNEGGGFVINDLANNNKGTLASPVKWKPNPRSMGLYQYTTTSFGAGYGISVPAKSVINDIKPVSIVIQAKADSLGSNYATDIRGGLFSKNRAFSIYAKSNNALRFTQQFSGGNYYWDTTDNYFSFGEYFTLGFTYKRSSTSDNPIFYKNGILNNLPTASPGGSFVSDASYDIYFLTHSYLSARWDGNINYCHLYNRILSPSEIQSLYESPYQFIKGPSTITYFTAPTGGWVWGGEVKNVMVA